MSQKFRKYDKLMYNKNAISRFCIDKNNKKEIFMDLDKKQKEIIQNKVVHGWKIGDIEQEFNYLRGEIEEAYEAYMQNKDDLGLELADVAIYLLGISEMLGFSLSEQIEKKMEINSHRIYKNINRKMVKFDDRTGEVSK